MVILVAPEGSYGAPGAEPDPWRPALPHIGDKIKQLF
jgi:hypothetical protein